MQYSTTSFSHTIFTQETSREMYMRGYMRAVLKKLWETVHNQDTLSLLPHKLASEGPQRKMAKGLTKYIFIMGEVLRGV